MIDAYLNAWRDMQRAGDMAFVDRCRCAVLWAAMSEEQREIAAKLRDREQAARWGRYYRPHQQAAERATPARSRSARGRTA